MCVLMVFLPLIFYYFIVEPSWLNYYRSCFVQRSHTLNDIAMLLIIKICHFQLQQQQITKKY